MRIGIIGTGWVGSSVAISLLHSGIATELLLHDAKPDLAEGEVMDLLHGASFFPNSSIRAVGLADMHNTDAVVFSAGQAGNAQQSRLDLLKHNVTITRQIGYALRGYTGIVIVVTNPVDILTTIMVDASGLSTTRVIGTGTMLDTARLRQIVGRELHLSPRAIHAQVVGEHGDSEVVLWSSAQVGGIKLKQWPRWNEQQEQRIASEVRKAAYEIIARKGATNHAIGLVTATLLRWILRDERRVLTVSSVQTGALGLHNVALSLPTIIGSKGILQVLEPTLSDIEDDGLRQSSQLLKKNIQQALKH